MSAIDLSELAALPGLVKQLQARVAQLEAQLAGAPPQTDRLVGVAEAAQMLGMTENAVRCAAQRGSLPSVKVGRRVRFRVSDLRR